MLRRGGARGPELHPFYPLSQLFCAGPLPSYFLTSFFLPAPSLSGPAAFQDPTPTPNAAQPLSATPNSLLHPYLGCR